MPQEIGEKVFVSVEIELGSPPGSIQRVNTEGIFVNTIGEQFVVAVPFQVFEHSVVQPTKCRIPNNAMELEDIGFLSVPRLVSQRPPQWKQHLDLPASLQTSKLLETAKSISLSDCLTIASDQSDSATDNFRQALAFARAMPSSQPTFAGASAASAAQPLLQPQLAARRSKAQAGQSESTESSEDETRANLPGQLPGAAAYLAQMWGAPAGLGWPSQTAVGTATALAPPYPGAGLVGSMPPPPPMLTASGTACQAIPPPVSISK